MFVTALLCWPSFAAQLKSITLPIAGTNIQPAAISADGNYLVGRFKDSGNRWKGFRMKVNATTADVIAPASGYDESGATDVSQDGSVVVGYSQNFANESISQGLVWTSSGGTSSLPAPPSGYNSTQPYGVSLDGTLMAIGHTFNSSKAAVASYPGPGNAYRALLSTDGSSSFSRANGIISDGSVVFGDKLDSTNVTRPCYWNSSSGTSFQYVDTLEGDVHDMSDTGVIVGNIGGWVSSSRPCYWTVVNTVLTRTNLPALNGVSTGTAMKVTKNGVTIFGQINGTCFQWTQGNGTVSLLSVATSAGINTTGWFLSAITDITPDGSRIIGSGSLSGTYPPFLLDLRSATVVPSAQIQPGVNVTILGVIGKTYQLQGSTDLDSTNWTNLGAPVTGTGVTIQSFQPNTSLYPFFRYLITTP